MELEILTDNKGYPIVYGMNLNTGEISYYTYDAKENTLQRYNNEVSKKLEKENKMYFYISIALGSFCIIELLIMIIILATRSNKNVKKIEETLEKTIKMNSIKEEPISKKELKRQRKEQLKQEKSLQDKQEECEKLLEQLNKVSILRQGNAGRTFNRCKILFISDNKTTFLLQSKLASNENQYFLATSLDSAINSLWFSLNKGFSDKSKLPTLFDVAIKAKLAISHQLSQKIKQDYSFVRERYSDFTEEDLANGYLILKKETQKAENLDFNNENAILDFLSTDILTMAQREKENQSRKAKIGHKNIVELRYRQQKDLFKEKMEVKKKIRLGIIFSTIITILIISLCFIFVCFGIYHIIKSLISENDTLLGIISLVLSIPILNILAFIKKKIFVYIDNMKKNTHASYRKILKPKIHSFRETGKDLAEFQ